MDIQEASAKLVQMRLVVVSARRHVHKMDMKDYKRKAEEQTALFKSLPLLYY